MKQLLLAFLCIFWVCGFNAKAQTLYSYTSATTGAPASVATNATGTSLTRVNGATAPGSPCGTGFSSTNFSSTATFSTSLQAVSVTVKPNAGYKLTVGSFSVGIRRSGTGPANNRLAYSLDGGATWIDKGSNDAPNNSGCGSVATASWNPTDFDVTSATNGIIFRIFGFGASSTGGTYQIMNLSINGTVTAVASCSTPAGLAANNITDVSADLSWNAVTGATGYEYVVDQVAAAPSTAGTTTGNIAVGVNSLTPNTTYYLHVRTVCGASFSSWETIPFLTLGCFNVVPGTIASSAGDTFCISGSTNLSLSGQSSGTGISYQWKSSADGILWTNVGSNSSTYNTGALTVTTYFKAFINCTPSSKTDSTEIDTITILTPPVPQVSIAASTGNTICAGTSTMFTATGLNAGSTPAFAWFKNNVPVGTNNSTYTDNNLNDNDVVFCVITSSDVCTADPDDTSAGIIMTVNPIVTPSATIAVAPGNTICNGTNTTFTVSPVNGGVSPAYQWQKNGIDVLGANATTFAIATLVNNDKISCVVTSNAVCPVPATINSDTITMTVNPVLTPAVTIAANPGNTICAGTSVTFTATPTNGGTSPVYQWKKNSVNVGTNSTTYTDNSLVNGDVITVVMTSNAVCANPATITGNSIVMVVNALITPGVTITANPGNTVCAGTPVTFTANPTNQGASPAYQWKKNNINVGANSATYIDNMLNNGDVITVVMTSNATCLTTTIATATGITMTVNPLLTPSASIGVTPGNIICNGTNTTFTVSPVNGGTSPAYQWRKNGTDVLGANAATFAIATLVNNDKISCVVTSNAVCPVPATINSDTITMTVNPVLTPAVTIAANPGNTICAGTSVTFTATPTNGGTSPVYQWKKNNVNVGTNSTTYTDNTLAQGDIVTCVLTSSETCVTNPIATGNLITMTVNTVVVPSVSLALTPKDTICTGASINFTTGSTNPGSNPTYIWRRNGNIISGATNSNYSSAVFNNGDIISVEMTSNATCAVPASATADTLIVVNPLLTPELSIFATPDTIICAGTQVGFSVQTVNAGTNPQYQWKLNGVNMIGATAATYMLNNLNNGNVITCELTSNAVCANPAMVNSTNTLTFKVSPTAAPVVSITSTPGTVINKGQEVTFNSIVTNGSTNPVYKWHKNGVEITGATGTTYKTKDLVSGDIIELVVYSSEPCAQPDSGKSNSLQFTVTNSIYNVSDVVSQLEVYPNPGNGNFTISGNASFEGKLEIAITDNLGRLIFTNSIQNHQGAIKENISLNGASAGVYYIKVSAGEQSTVKRLIIQH